MFKFRLKELREFKKASQKQVATVIGVTTNQFQRYEYGEQEPTMGVLIALADYFDVSLDYLTGRTKKSK